MLHYCNTFNSSHLLCCNLFVSLLVRIKICQPTSVALPWLSACSVKLQLLWMCSFPWRRDESWACRTCTQVNGKIRGTQKSRKKRRKGEWKKSKPSGQQAEVCWQECETCGRSCYPATCACLCIWQCTCKRCECPFMSVGTVITQLTFCLVLQMFSRSVMRAVLRWCSARSSSSNVLVISATASVFLSFSWREISLTSSMAAVSWGSLQDDPMWNFLFENCRTKTKKKQWS